MLVPQFSLRWVLGSIAIAAVVLLLVRLALQRHEWAMALVAALTSLALPFVLYAAMFFVVWLLSLLRGGNAGRDSTGDD